MARHSFSICAYLCSVVDNFLDAKATGCPFCISRELKNHDEVHDDDDVC